MLSADAYWGVWTQLRCYWTAAVLFLWFVSFFSKRLRGGPMAMQINLHTESGCFDGFCFSMIFFYNPGIFPNFPVVTFAIAGF